MGFRAGPFLTEQAISRVSGRVSRSRCVAVPTLWLAALGLDPTLVNSQPRTYSVRDSVGIVIVENRSQLWQPGREWRFAAAPSVQIGQVDGDSSLLLTNIRAATRFSDGRVAVAQTGHVRYFGPDGRFLRYVGRAGRGPGEFSGTPLQLRVLRGDSLAATVFEPELIFDEKGNFARSQAVSSQSALTGPHMLARSTLLNDGTRILAFFEREDVRRRSPPGIARPPQGFLRFDPAGSRADTLGWFPGSEVVVQSESQRGVMALRPFARNTLLAVGGDRVFLGDSDASSFFVFTTGIWPGSAATPARSAPMKLRAILRKPTTFQPITEPDRAEWIEQARAPLLSLQGRAAAARNPERMRVESDYLEQGISNARWPATKPGFAALLGDRVGNLWIQEYSRRGDPQRFTVLDREGRWLGTVTAPPGVTVLEIGADYMLGVWKNADDVEFLRVYPLTKPIP